MRRSPAIRRLFVFGLALAAGPTLPGCVYTGLHSQTRFWADSNTYGRPAFVIEHVDHLPERRQYVEYLRWQYGLGPGRVPVIEPAVAAVDPVLFGAPVVNRSVETPRYVSPPAPAPPPSADGPTLPPAPGPPEPEASVRPMAPALLPGPAATAEDVPTLSVPVGPDPAVDLPPPPAVPRFGDGAARPGLSPRLGDVRGGTWMFPRAVRR